MEYQKLFQMIRYPNKLFMHLAYRGFFNWMPDKPYIQCMFNATMGKKLNLSDPKTFNEKLQWIKLYDRRPEYSVFVDKYEVRTYIEKKIGSEYLVPLINVYDKVEDIDFEKLPDQFVLKCTHDSGGIFICKDKKSFDIKATCQRLRKSLNRNYYLRNREWPYKNVIPRIICEKYLEDAASSDLIDYKFMCFNGKVEYIFVCSNRSNGLNIDIYDKNWNLTKYRRAKYPNSGKVMDKPVNFNKMVEIAEELSKNIPFIRVDLYEVNNHLYFGELTLFPSSGFAKFEPESFDDLLGSYLNLPK